MISIIQFFGYLLGVFPQPIQVIISAIFMVGLVTFLLKLIKLILDAIPFV